MGTAASHNPDEPTPPPPDDWAALHRLPPQLLALRPDFLVISPPKTGSTWLASNLRAHPGVFVPAVKELKYFSSLFKWLAPDWYLSRFGPGAGRVRGEASPSYALLPVSRIRLLRRLLPDLKLIFLMRDPVSRAWSHARHTRRFGEAGFAPDPDGGGPTDADWQANFAHDWPAAGGDYLGQLRRWLSVFPREQVYVGFYESIATAPADLLRDIFAFLGVESAVDLSGFPVKDRILPGPPGVLPPDLRRFLRRLLHPRTAELAAFLKDRLRLDPPPEWADTLRPPEDMEPAAPPVPAFARANDDNYLARVLEQEETFPTAHARVQDDYLGYDISFVRGRLFAVARSVGPADLPAGLSGADEPTLRRLAAAGDCLTAPTLAELKEQVARHALGRVEARVRGLEERLAETEGRVARLEAGLGRAAGVLERLDAEAVRLSPRERGLLDRGRRVGRGMARTWRWARSLRPARVLAGLFSGLIP